jgi:hypothetical protein
MMPESCFVHQRDRADHAVLCPAGKALRSRVLHRHSEVSRDATDEDDAQCEQREQRHRMRQQVAQPLHDIQKSREPAGLLRFSVRHVCMSRSVTAGRRVLGHRYAPSRQMITVTPVIASWQLQAALTCPIHSLAPSHSVPPCAVASSPHVSYTARIVFTTRTRRIILGIMLALIALAASLWWLSSTPPRWYQPPDTHDAEAGELAALVEHRLAEEVHKIRDDESPWRLRIREEQVNAWLATRLHRWLEYEQGVQWPAQLGPPQVRFDADTISVALLVPAAASDGSRGIGGGRPRIVTVTLTPYLHEDEIRFTLTGLRIGRLAAPGDPMKHATRLIDLHSGKPTNSGDELSQFIARLLQGEAGIAPWVNLVDHRRVELQQLELRRGFMDISAITMPPDRAAGNEAPGKSE